MRGKSRITVINLLRLLNLESTVRHMLESSEIEMGHARASRGWRRNWLLMGNELSANKAALLYSLFFK